MDSQASPQLAHEIQACLRAYADLRSAERVLSPSITRLRDDAWQARTRQIRERVEELVRLGQELASGETIDRIFLDRVRKDLGCVMTELSDFRTELLKFVGEVSEAQFRATLPPIAREHRCEVNALLDLMVSDDHDLESRRTRIEYVVTLLSTSDSSDSRTIESDPATLTPALEALCDRIAASCSMDPEEHELAFFEAASLPESADLVAHVRLMREKKRELGMACFHPGILRSIVTYNVHMANRVRRVANRSRDDDFAFETCVDDVSSMESIEESPATSESCERYEEREESEEVVSIQESDGFERVREAVSRRLRGIPIGSCTSERIALSLDLPGLESGELEILKSDTKDVDPVLRSAILVGCLNDVFPVIEEKLLEMGITRKHVQEDWTKEMDQQLQDRMASLLAENRYEEACDLSEFKARHLYSSLSRLARERRGQEEGRPACESETASDAVADDMRAAAREAVEELRGSRARERVAPVRRNAEAREARPRPRRGLMVAAFLLAIALIGFNLTGRAPADTRVLRARELSDLSPYLKTAYRNGGGSGELVIGQVDEAWSSLAPPDRVEAARSMGRHLLERDIRDAMIYDANHRLQIHLASGRLRKPAGESEM